MKPTQNGRSGRDFDCPSVFINSSKDGEEIKTEI
jgi:hypothetical protein